MRLDLLQPLHPRLQVARIQEHILAAEARREPVVQELRLAPRIVVTVVDKYPQLPRRHRRLLGVARCPTHPFRSPLSALSASIRLSARCGTTAFMRYFLPGRGYPALTGYHTRSFISHLTARRAAIAVKIIICHDYSLLRIWLHAGEAYTEAGGTGAGRSGERPALC